MHTRNVIMSVKVIACNKCKITSIVNCKYKYGVTNAGQVKHVNTKIVFFSSRELTNDNFPRELTHDNLFKGANM